MRTGILGGTFDPPHIGHLLLGECARHQLGLDRVLFMVAGEPYHKPERDVTPAAARLAMVERAVAGNDAFAADDRELRRGGPTYTADTLRELEAEARGELWLILGADTLVGLSRWREPEAIIALARIAVAPKGRTERDLAAIARDAGLEAPPPVIDMPDLDVSSTLVRTRVAEGKPVRYLVSDAVWRYIEEHGLYR